MKIGFNDVVAILGVNKIHRGYAKVSGRVRLEKILNFGVHDRSDRRNPRN